MTAAAMPMTGLSLRRLAGSLPGVTGPQAPVPPVPPAPPGSPGPPAPPPLPDPPGPPDPPDASGGKTGLAGICAAGGKAASPSASSGSLGRTAGKVPSAAPNGLTGSAVQFDLAGASAGPAVADASASAGPAVADAGSDVGVADAGSDAGSDVGWRLASDASVGPPDRSDAGAGTAVLAGAVLAGSGGLAGVGLGWAGLAGAGLAEVGLGGVRSALLVNVGHGPLSGSADGTGRAALRVLPGPDGLLAMTVGAEAGTAGGAAGETGPSGRRNPDGLSDRGWSADAGDPAATVPSAGRESWPARSSCAPTCTISSTRVSVGTTSDDRRADQMNKQAQNKAMRSWYAMRIDGSRRR